MKKIFMIVLLAFILYGCAEKSLEKLDTPKYLVFTDRVYFNYVDHATSYILEINGVEYEITTNSYHFALEGDYTVRVKARAEGYEDSLYSEPIEFSLDFTYEIPTSVMINTEHLVTWDVMDGAIRYTVYVNGQGYDTTDNSYSLLEFDATVFVVQVRAVYTSGASIASEIVIDEGRAEIISTIKFNYSIQSSFDLSVIHLDSLIYILEESAELELDLSKYQYAAPQMLSMNASFLNTLSVGKHTFKVVTYEGYFMVEMNIIDTIKPYIISSSEVNSDFSTDIIFLYELFEGSIKSVTGNDITADDYSIDGGVLTVDIDYVRNKFETEPERTTLILSYTLEQGENIVLGYLFIRPLFSDIPTL